MFATTTEGDMRPRADNRHPRAETGESQLFLVLCTTTVEGGMRPQPDGRHPAPSDATISATTLEGGRHTAPARRSASGAGHRHVATIFAAMPNCANNISIQRDIPSFQCHTGLASAWYHCIALPRCIVAFKLGVLACLCQRRNMFHSGAASFSFFRRGIAAIAASEAGTADAIGMFARPTSQAFPGVL